MSMIRVRTKEDAVGRSPVIKALGDLIDARVDKIDEGFRFVLDHLCSDLGPLMEKEGVGFFWTLEVGPIEEDFENTPPKSTLLH